MLHKIILKMNQIQSDNYYLILRNNQTKPYIKLSSYLNCSPNLIISQYPKLFVLNTIY